MGHRCAESLLYVGPPFFTTSEIDAPTQKNFMGHKHGESRMFRGLLFCLHHSSSVRHVETAAGGGRRL